MSSVTAQGFNVSTVKYLPKFCCCSLCSYTNVMVNKLFLHCIHTQPRPIYVQQQQQQNNVVVMQQAAPVTIVRPSIHQSDAGQGALVFAIIITLFALVCGCWWSIVCSIPGIVFASSVS